MFERSLTGSKSHRPPAAFAGSVLVHSAFALLLLNLTLPQTAQRNGFRIVPLYIPATNARESVATRAPRRMLSPPPSPRTRLELLPPLPLLITPARSPEPLRVSIPEVARPAMSEPEPMPLTVVRTGAFEQRSPVVEKVTRPRAVVPIGSFDSASAPVRPQVPDSAPVQVGGLEPREPVAPKGASYVAIASAGFGTATAGSRPRNDAAAGASVSPAFGPARATPPRAVSPGRIARTEFGSVEARPAAKLEPVDDRSAALEILDKPRPVYSEEGRKLKLEGVVVLEMSFSVDGQPRVLRVLRGLGHGLDKNAMEAAMGIRFRPALEHGRPVDTVALVRIEFQLAY